MSQSLCNTNNVQSVKWQDTMPIRYDIMIYKIPAISYEKKKETVGLPMWLWWHICAQFQIFTSTPDTALHRSGCNRLAPDWYNMFLGMDFSCFCQEGQTSFAFNIVAMKNANSSLPPKSCKHAKLQAFNVNVNHPAHVKQHFVRHAKVYAWKC